jgi:hypothetical protein
MLYTTTLTVPANTPVYSPVSVVIRPTTRRLKGISILFPSGVDGSVGIRITDNGIQVAPVNDWLYGNNETIAISEDRLLSDASRLIIEGWSSAEDWNHSVNIRVFME